MTSYNARNNIYFKSNRHYFQSKALPGNEQVALCSELGKDSSTEIASQLEYDVSVSKC